MKNNVRRILSIFLLFVLCDIGVIYIDICAVYALSDGAGRASLLANRKILSADKAFVSRAEKFLVKESKSGKAIKKIDVVGNDRIVYAAVIAHSGLGIGKKYEGSALNDSVKALYATGFFEDIKIYYNDATSTITIKVAENPTVNQVAFKGNSKLDDKDLTNIVQMKPMAIYSLSAVANDVKLIAALYQRIGFFAVVVKPKIIKRRDNRVDILYVVDENKKAKIGKVLFSGNEKILDADLRKVIGLTEYSWFRIFSDKGLYRREQIAMDRDALDQFYHSMGYADFKVLDVISELSPQKDSFVVTFVLYEGEKYRIGNVDVVIANNIYGVDAKKIKDMLGVRHGLVYSKNVLDSDIEVLKYYLGTRGYAFADVSYTTANNVARSVVDIVFTIREGSKLYINKINIKDNIRTLDRVIRREMRLHEGDSFNADLFKASQYAIEGLGYFSEVHMEPRETNVPDKIDLDITVREKPTGTLNLLGGYESGNGPIGSFSISENNLLGTGNTASFEFKKDRYKTDLSLGFNQPYFDDRNLLIGSDIFFHDEVIASRHTDPDTQKNDKGKWADKSLKQRTIGASVYAAYPLFNRLTYQVRYSPKHENVTSYEASTSELLKSAAGKHFISTIGQSFIYDKRNNAFSPSEGYYIRLAQDLDGVGGSVKNFKNVADISYYYPLYKNSVVLHVNGGAGSVVGYGGDIVCLNHNFYLGMYDIRGFDLNGIGPRDAKTWDVVGGKYYYKLSAEVNFPLGLPKEFGVKGAVFLDSASSFGVDISKDLKEKYARPNNPNCSKCNNPQPGTCLYWDDHKLRSSYGIGVLWNSPLGSVIRIDYGWVISKATVNQSGPFMGRDIDSTNRFRLTFTQQF